VAIFVGRIDSTNAVERRQGVLDVLAGIDQKEMDKKTPPDAAGLDLGNGFTLIATKVDGSDVKNCQAQAEHLLVKHPDVDCLTSSAISRSRSSPVSRTAKTTC
jgi:hypothetical protein